MKALIAVTTCELYRQNGNNEAILDTWVKDVPKVEGLDIVLFTGQDTVFINPKKYEVRLNVPDDYRSVTYKMIESRRWALKYGYDFVFQTYPDVYIRPERLMAALQTDKDYVGYPITAPDGVPYASGGAGYWNSRKACEYIVTSDQPYDWAEDRWVGHVMARNHVTLWADKRYSPWANPPLKRNERITAHLSRSIVDGQAGSYKAQWMRNMHKFWELSQNV